MKVVEFVVVVTGFILLMAWMTLCMVGALKLMGLVQIPYLQGLQVLLACGIGFGVGLTSFGALLRRLR